MGFLFENNQRYVLEPSQNMVWFEVILLSFIYYSCAAICVFHIYYVHAFIITFILHVLIISSILIVFLFFQHLDYENMTKDVNRSAYTKRILEIVSNIKKQKQQIDKVCFDIFHTK